VLVGSFLHNTQGSVIEKFNKTKLLMERGAREEEEEEEDMMKKGNQFLKYKI